MFGKIRENINTIIFVFYLLSFAVMAMMLAVIQPLDPLFPLLPNPPDEFTKYVIPEYICATGKIPTGFEASVQIAGYGGSYAFLPILPYILMGYFMRVLSCFLSDRTVLLIAARMVNVFSGTLMAVIVYRLSERVFQDRRFRWLFSFMVMFWPEHLFIHTYINTESMSNLSIAMILYAMVCIYQEGTDRKKSLFLSAGMILCILTYYNAYGYVLIGTVLFIVHFPLRKELYKDRFPEVMRKHCLFVFFTVLFGAGWWFVRNLIVLNGDLFGMSTLGKVREALGVDLGVTYSEQGKSILQMFQENDLAERMLTTYICCYGAASIYAGPGLYLFYKLFLLGGIMEMLLTVIGKKKPDRVRLLWHGSMVGAILMVCMLWLIYAYWMDFQPQGRYLLAMILPFTYYVTRGWQRLAGRLKLNEKFLTAAAVIAIGLTVYWELDFILFTMFPVCMAG